MNDIKLIGETTEECYQIVTELIRSGEWRLIDGDIYIGDSLYPYPKKKNGLYRFNTTHVKNGQNYRVDLSPKKIGILLTPPKNCLKCNEEFRIDSNRNNPEYCYRCHRIKQAREIVRKKAENRVVKPIIEIGKVCVTCGEDYVITSKTVRKNKEICVSCNEKLNRRCWSFNDRSWKRIGQVTNEDGDIIYEYVERNAIIEKYNSTCACCGIKCHDSSEHWTHDKLNMDHIVPIGLGGVHRKGNVQLLCNYCNSIKAIEDGWPGYALGEQQERLMKLMIHRAEFNTRNRTEHIYPKRMRKVINESLLVGLEIFVDLEKRLARIKNVYDDDVEILVELIKLEVTGF